MGDPGNKARKDDDRAEFPRRQRGQDVNQHRDLAEEWDQHPRRAEKNWAAAGTQGSAADAPAMPVDREAEEKKKEEREE